MGAIRTVKVNNGQKYLLTETMGPEGERDIQILARPTATKNSGIDGVIVGREYRLYLDFSYTTPPADGSVTAEAGLIVQPIRDHTCQVDIQATIHGGKQQFCTFSVKVGNQTILSHADGYSWVGNRHVRGTGLSIYFYVGKDHKLRALAQCTSLTENLVGMYEAGNGSYTTAQLESGAGTYLNKSAPTSLLIGPWGSDFSLNYYRRSYYEGSSASGQPGWELPWMNSILGVNGMAVTSQGTNTWRVPYNDYLQY